MPSVLVKGRHVPYDVAVHGATARLVPDYKTDEIGQLVAFLKPLRFTSREYWASYPSWNRGEALERDRWARTSGLGGTYTMQALMWYQHHYRPGSTVCRPSIILDALVRAVCPLA